MKKILLFIFLIISGTYTVNAQAIRWGARATTTPSNLEEAKAIAADSSGNTYITGWYNDTTSFGNTLLHSRGNKDAFIAKLDPNGNFIWAKSFGSNLDDEGLAIAVDKTGNIFVTGYYSTKVFFSATDSLVSLGGTDIFIAKFDNGGTLLMKHSEGALGDDYGRAIAINSVNGNYAVVGDQSNNLYFFAAKYNSLGSQLFSKLFSATTVTGTGAAFTNTDILYTTGYYTGNLQESPATSMINSGGQDGFYLAFNSAGTNFDSYKGYQGTGTYSATGVFCSGITAYICGSFQQANWVIGYYSSSNQAILGGSSSYTYGFVEKISGTSGHYTSWANQYTSGALYSVKGDVYGNTYVHGDYSSLFQYNSYGELNWYSSPTGNYSFFRNYGLDVDYAGNVYGAGSNGASGINFGDSIFTGSINTTAIVQKISSVRIVSPVPGTTFCRSTVESDSLMVSISPTMAYNSPNTFTVQADVTGTGNFTSTITIGTLTTTGAGIIHCYIPPGTSNNYIDLRILSSNPSTTVGDKTYLIVHLKPLPNITSANPMSRCPAGSSSSITISDYQNGMIGNYAYSWSPSVGISSSYYDAASTYATTTTTYTYALTDTYTGCTGHTTLQVNVYPAVTIAAGIDTTICRGTSAVLHTTSTNATSYSWSPSTGLSSGTSANPVCSPTSYTTYYYVTATSANGCTATDEIDINSPQTTANAGPVSYNSCLGAPVQLTGTSTGSNGRKYSWTPSATLNDANISNPVATPNSTTTYILTATDSINHCSGVDSIKILLGPIVVTAPNINITCGNSGTIAATVTGNYVTPITYSWTPSAGLSSTTTASVTANPSATTTYYVTMTTGNGCSGSDPATVNVVSPNYNVNFSANNQLLTTTPFIAQFSNTTPSPSSYTFTWVWGDGTTTQSNNATVFHNYQYNGNYDVILIAVNNSTGCSDSMFQGGYIFCTGGTGCSLSATVSSPQGTTKCVGDSILLTCNTASNYTYQWNYNGVGISGATTSSIYAHSQGNYTVTIGDGSCSVISQPKSLTFTTAPAAPTITHSGALSACGGGTVFLTANSGYASYAWSTGATSQNITANQSGVYTVTVSSGSGCTSSSSYSLNASAMATPDICMVGVDSLTGTNLVIWDKPVTTQIDSFIIYREGIVANQFDRIGAQPYSDFSTYQDANSNPQQQSYRYKISIKDTCGVETLKSAYHKTIHLTINQGAGSTWNLLWNLYDGLSIPTYNIYRGTSPTALTLLTSISGSNSSYTDLSPPSGLIYYQIEALHPSGCNPSARTQQNYSSSLSNVVDNGFTVGIAGVQKNEVFELYPNPSSGDLNVVFKSTNDIKNKVIDIFDALGRVVYSKQIIVNGVNAIERFNVSELNQGVYFVRIKDSKSESTVRFIKTN